MIWRRMLGPCIRTRSTLCESPFCESSRSADESLAASGRLSKKCCLNAVRKLKAELCWGEVKARESWGKMRGVVSNRVVTTRVVTKRPIEW